MAAITKEQVRRIYALGSAAGILEPGNKDDLLHALVKRLTGKDSVSCLTAAEFKKVERELLPLLQYKNRKEPLKPKAGTAPGMMNKAQQALAWRLVYKLKELDIEVSTATVGERMVGAIKKILDVDATVDDPFRWITQEQGSKLIVNLKWYVAAAQYRATQASKKGGSG